MALIKCENCGGNISDKAKVCPHCGRGGGWCSTRYENQPHNDQCYSFVVKCVREKWRADCGHEWTQWTCEY